MTSLADSGPGSLREAIDEANVAEGTDTIDFDVYGVIALESQLPVVTGELTINGPGAELLTLDAGDGADSEFGTGDGFRIFNLDDGDDDTTRDVVISGMTLTGGDLPKADGYNFSGGLGDHGEDGGAIRSRENLSIADSVITGNASGHGLDGFVTYLTYSTPVCQECPGQRWEIAPGDGGRGGGVWVDRANLTVTNSRITGNRTGDGGAWPEGSVRYGFAASGSGGGIGVAYGDLALVDSVISGNSTSLQNGSGYRAISGGGGGVFVGRYFHNAIDPSEVSIESSSISGNRSLFGAAISTTYSSVAIQDSTISGNEARFSSGAIAAVYGDLTLSNSTLSGNEVVEPRSSDPSFTVKLSRLNPGGFLTVEQSTITGNTGGIAVSEVGNVFLRGALVAGNGGTDIDWRHSPYWGSVFESSHSLVGAAEIPELVDGHNGNRVGTPELPIDPRLAPLADNGGPTLTHALLPDSPALNAGDPTALAGADDVPLYDQRGEGFSRVVEGRIDIGAVEGFVVASPSTRGDFNADGVIDGLDDEAWRFTYGATVDPYTGADANGNGRIEAGDYTVWRDNYTPRDVDILRTSIAPVIDGAPDPLWESVPVQTIEHTVFGSVDSPSDASATWRAVWDDNAFYLYAEIVDQRLIRDSSFAFEDDGLEVFFDPDFSRQSAYDGVDDTQYMFRIADGQPVGSPASPVGATEGVVYATGSNPNGGGYTIEAAIPWSAFNAWPIAGDLLGLEFALQDDDDGGGIGPSGADGRRQWFGTSNQSFLNPSRFGVAVLSPRFPTIASPVSLASEPIAEPAPPRSVATVRAAGIDAVLAVLPRDRQPFRAATREPMRDDGGDPSDEALLQIEVAASEEDSYDLAPESPGSAEELPEASVDEALAAVFGSDLR